MKTMVGRAVPFLIVAVVAVLIGWWVVVQSDPDQLTGPRVFVLVMLGAGVTLAFVGQAVEESAVTVDGVMTVVLFAGLYAAAVFAADSDSDLAGLDAEILIGVLLAGVVFVLNGIRHVVHTLIQRRHPSPELAAITDLSEQVEQLRQQVDHLRTGTPPPALTVTRSQGSAVRWFIARFLPEVMGR